MTHIVSVDSGVMGSVYWCHVCELYADIHLSRRDEIYGGECYEDDPAGWNELKEKMEAIKNGNKQNNNL